MIDYYSGKNNDEAVHQGKMELGSVALAIIMVYLLCEKYL